MNQPVFTYNQDVAVAASSAGKYITESCVSRGFIMSAKWTTGQNSSAEFLELTFESEQGQTANYISINYRKKDGKPNEIGVGQIQNLMGVTGVKSLSRQQSGNDIIAPELTRKAVTLALERENGVKLDGTAKFSLAFRGAFSANSGKTVAEHINNEQAKSIEYWRARLAENPQGKPVSAPAQNQQYAAFDNAAPAHEDDIPF